MIIIFYFIMCTNELFFILIFFGPTKIISWDVVGLSTLPVEFGLTPVFRWGRLKLRCYVGKAPRKKCSNKYVDNRYSRMKRVSLIILFTKLVFSESLRIKKGKIYSKDIISIAHLA